MKKLWHYIFSHKLQIPAQEQPLLITLPSSLSGSDAAHVARIIFEKVQAPALYIGLRCVLILHAQGLDTSLVLEIGKDSTSATCVCDGHVVETSIERSQNSCETVLEHSKQVSHGNERKVLIDDVESLKDDAVPRYGYIATNFKAELGQLRRPGDAGLAQVERWSDFNGDNDDLDPSVLSKARFEAPVVLFQPKMFDFMLESLQEVAVRSISRCESKDLPRRYGNIILVSWFCFLIMSILNEPCRSGR